MKKEEIQALIYDTVKATVDELLRLNAIRPPTEAVQGAVADRLARHYAGEKDAELVLAISSVLGDPFYGLIPLYWQGHKTLEQIAEIMHCDVSTVSRNKKRLLLKLYEELRK